MCTEPSALRLMAIGYAPWPRRRWQCSARILRPLPEAIWARLFAVVPEYAVTWMRWLSALEVPKEVRKILHQRNLLD
jgi:hypothetical protein